MKCPRIGGATALALAPFLVVGCQYDPYSDQYARASPPRGAIVGRWGLDAGSRAMIRSMGYPVSEPTLEFRDDGTFVARDIPDCWNFDGREVRKKTESGAGTWSLGTNQGYWVLRPLLTEINGEKRGRGVLLQLTGQATPYKILATVGDPDAGKAMVFEKRSGETP